MKKSHTLLIFVFFILLLSSCSPRIGTTITKTYLPTSEDTDIVVYQYQTEIPVGTESIGKVKITDTGFSTNCDSLSVIGIVKKEARKVGGNAVCITDHIKPSFFGSSCHQMSAIILRVSDFAYVQQTDSIVQFTNEQSQIEKSSFSKFKIGVNMGYGWRNAKIQDGRSMEMHDFYEKLMSEAIWDVAFNYYFNDNYGVGLIYSPYDVTENIYVGLLETGEIGTLKAKTNITFIAPTFDWRWISNNGKWIFNTNLGIGYMGYRHKETFKNQSIEESSATVGFLWGISEEYKFSNHWGISLNFSMLSGLLNSLNVNENGRKYTLDLKNNNEKVGLGQYRLSAGVRYYF